MDQIFAYKQMDQESQESLEIYASTLTQSGKPFQILSYISHPLLVMAKLFAWM